MTLMVGRRDGAVSLMVVLTMSLCVSLVCWSIFSAIRLSSSLTAFRLTGHDGAFGADCMGEGSSDIAC